MDLKKIIEALKSGDEEKVKGAETELQESVKTLMQEKNTFEQKVTEAETKARTNSSYENEAKTLREKLEVITKPLGFDIKGKNKEQISDIVKTHQELNEKKDDDKYNLLKQKFETLSKEKDEALSIATLSEEKFKNLEKQTLEQKVVDNHKNIILNQLDNVKNHDQVSKNLANPTAWGSIRQHFASKFLKKTQVTDEGKLKFVNEDGTQALNGTKNKTVLDALTDDFENAKKEQESSGQGNLYWTTSPQDTQKEATGSHQSSTGSPTETRELVNL